MLRHVIIGLGCAAAVAAAVPAAAQTPTFNKDVAPILFRSCAECHRPNQIAPMALLSYQDARPWARAIKAKVQAREMPPWFADPKFGKFKNDRSLTDAEIRTLTAWADAGAPQGTGAAPTPPRFADAGWSHPSGAPPDLVIEFPIAWKVDAQGEMPNFNLYTPLPFSEARYVSATQVLPGNVEATHHITTNVQNMPPGTRLGTGPAWPGGPVNPYVPVAAERGVTVENTGDLAVAEDEDDGGGFGAYIPGAGARVSRPGQARLIRADRFKYVRWNLHYQATGKPETAQPAIGVWWKPAGEITSVEQSMRMVEQTSEGQPVIAGSSAASQHRLRHWRQPDARADSAGRWELDGHWRGTVHGRRHALRFHAPHAPEGQGRDLLAHAPGRERRGHAARAQLRLQLAVPVPARPAGQGAGGQHDEGDRALRQLVEEPHEPIAGQRGVLVRAELGRHVPHERALLGGQAREEAAADVARAALTP